MMINIESMTCTSFQQIAVKHNVTTVSMQAWVTTVTKEIPMDCNKIEDDCWMTNFVATVCTVPTGIVTELQLIVA